MLTFACQRESIVPGSGQRGHTGGQFDETQGRDWVSREYLNCQGDVCLSGKSTIVTVKTSGRI